jgi:alkylation response protein AidB-like acyl-CoA dehydrogenase
MFPIETFYEKQLPEHERDIVQLVGDFVDAKVRPVARDREHADRYPADLIEEMKRMGIYGMRIPEPYGQGQVSTVCFALVTAQLSRGWMSLGGAMGGHSVVASLLDEFGTDQQKERFLPRMACGELRATMALTETQGGSDLQAIRTTARRNADGYMVNGTKMWISNAQRSGLIALLVKTDPRCEPRHQGMSVLLVEPGAGLTVGPPLSKLGYKGVETCELVFKDHQAPDDAVLGGKEGRGFAQMMRGLELGRIQVAGRAIGVGTAAFQAALEYAKDRTSFGKAIWRHQAVGHQLSDMATDLTAARLLLLEAAHQFDTDKRSDLTAGMAKLAASEACMRIALQAMRIHGGSGYSTEYEVERYFRDAPLMIVGEGTNEIQREVIVNRLVAGGT